MLPFTGNLFHQKYDFSFKLFARIIFFLSHVTVKPRSQYDAGAGDVLQTLRWCWNRTNFYCNITIEYCIASIWPIKLSKFLASWIEIWPTKKGFFFDALYTHNISELGFSNIFGGWLCPIISQQKFIMFLMMGGTIIIAAVWYSHVSISAACVGHALAMHCAWWLFLILGKIN